MKKRKVKRGKGEEGMGLTEGKEIEKKKIKGKLDMKEGTKEIRESGRETGNV